ncbi:hypothetical protein SK128_002880 [Halocaridina rubra]|uniref:Uncharacterized protein n=1 Tax=Halocaridina rubra TaxID=373956 RepID=A0AAN8WMD7_HALRR
MEKSGYGYGRLIIPSEILANDETLEQMSEVIANFQKMSKCLTLLLISDNLPFLTAFLEGYLVNQTNWQNKLLILTKLPISEVHPLRNSLSTLNSMVVTPENSVSNKRLIDSTQLTVAAEEYPPHCKVEEVLQGGSLEPQLIFSGPILTMLDILAKDINFTYSMKRPPDNSWGVKLPDGSWVGMVGMVYRKEVDMALGPFGMNPVRKSAVDFTKIMLIDSVRIIAKQGKSEVDPWGFLFPLDRYVWLSVFVALLIVVSAVVVLAYLDTDGKGILNVHLFCYFRVFLQQDMGIDMAQWWQKFLIGAWLMTTLIITKSYSGNLMSLLAVRYIPQPLQSLRDVLDALAVTMVWEGNTEYTQYIQSVDSGIFYEVAQSESVGRMVYTTGSDYGITLENLVMRGDYVLIIEDLSCRMLLAEHFTRSGKCDFYMSSELFLPSAMAMITQKNSPLGPSIDKRLSGLTESGLYMYWIQNAVPNSTSCLHPPTKVLVESSLSITNIWVSYLPRRKQVFLVIYKNSDSLMLRTTVF